jgi:hypothetical protein
LDLALICFLMGVSAPVFRAAFGSTAVLAQTREEAPPSEEEQRVEALLGAGIETSTPVSAYAALGESGTRALIAIFERETAPRHVRLRALSALAGLENDTATDYLATLLEARDERQLSRLGSLHPKRSASVLRRTLRGLERRHKRVATTDVMPYLTHRDAAVRLAAVRLLARKPENAVTLALNAQRDRERVGQVQKALALALKGRSAPPAAPRQDAPKNGSQPR